MQLNENDVVFNVVVFQGREGYCVKATHRPTGITIQREGKDPSSIKMELLEDLRSRLVSMQPLFEKRK